MEELLGKTLEVYLKQSEAMSNRIPEDVCKNTAGSIFEKKNLVWISAGLCRNLSRTYREESLLEF